MIKVKFFSNDFGMMVDVKYIDFTKNKFDIVYQGQKITLDNIGQLLLDTGDKLIKLDDLKDKPDANAKP